MSLLATVLLVQATAATPAVPPLPTVAAPPSAQAAEEIVVIGRKLKSWQGGVYKRNGKLTCRIRKGTGDKDIDAIGCGAMLRCIAPRQADFDRLAALDIPKADRNRQMNALAQEIQPCVDQAREAGMRYLADARVARK